MTRPVKNGLTVVAFVLAFNLCLIFNVAECKSSLQRTVCSKYNYCGGGSCNGTLNYFKATGPDDVLHYAWSTTGYPSVFISRSPQSNSTNTKDCVSNFHVNYANFASNQQPGSVSIDGALTNFSFGLIFKSLVEFKVSTKKLPAAGAFHPQVAYNCSENKPDDCPYHVYQLNNSNLSWSSYDPSEGLSAYDKNGSLMLNLKVNPRSDGGYEHDYSPKPWYTANSTTFDLLIKNFGYKLSESSRLALEINVVQGDGVSNFGGLGQKYSKDDEYTPSIFYTRYFSFSGEQGHGHVRWKPITYITRHRKSSNSQQVNDLQSVTVNSTQKLPRSLVGAIFNNSFNSSTTIFLVFGTEKDDNALNSDMYTWTGSIGYGDQPDEPFSLLVILVIVIGLGIPAVLTVLAVGFVISLNIYKWRKRRRGYSRI